MSAKTLATVIRICSLVLFFPFNSPGQTLISGIVADVAGKPLPAASVLLLNGADSTLVKGQLSTMEGSYSFEGVEPGEYRLGVSMLGYTHYFSDVFTLNNQSGEKDLGTTVLEENAQQLDEVSIVAKRPLFEQKIDRLVVNVATSVTSAGSTALEVLQRSPGVLVNRGAGWINMSGKNGVLIMINGKISRLPPSAIIQLLEGMNADNIERIELIHTPPANFDAEGNAGIINIVLKKNVDDGLNGSYSLSAGYGLKEKAGANLNFNYRRNKVNLYGDYSWNYDNNPQIFSNYRSIKKDGTILETDGVSDRDPTRTHTQNARLGFDIQLSPKTVLGLLTGWMDRYWTMNAFNTVKLRENGAPSGFIHIPNDEVNHWSHYLGNINLEHQFNKEQRLNFDLDYAYYYFTNPSNYTNRYLDAGEALLNETQLRVHKTTLMSILAGKADYTRQFGEKATLESGLKGTVTRFNNDVLVEDLMQEGWIRNPDYSADYSMEEDIAAVYSAFTLKLNEKTDMKAGLRYEFTRSNLGSPEQPDIVDREYGNLFPSLFLSRKINKNNTLQFSYSRRINRPNFMQLAPYFIFYDPNTIETGNPQLQPSVVDAVKTDYIWKSVQLSLQYSYEDDVIIQGQPEVDPVTNRQVNGALNYDYSKNAAATITFPVRPFNWWEIQASASAQWQEYKGKQNGKVSKQSRAYWYGFMSQSFRLPKQFTIELSTFYYSGGPYGKTVSRPLGELNAGIQKELGGNLGTLRFNVSDILFSAIWTSTIDDPAENFYYRGQYRQTERIFRLTYSNKFGSNKVKDARRRTTGSEEERRRVN